MSHAHDPRIPSEKSRRARTVTTRVPSKAAIERLHRAAKVEDVTVHAFVARAIEYRVEQTLALASVRKVVAERHRSKVP
jgi:hypothetical protein